MNSLAANDIFWLAARYKLCYRQYAEPGFEGWGHDCYR